MVLRTAHRQNIEERQEESGAAGAPLADDTPENVQRNINQSLSSGELSPTVPAARKQALSTKDAGMGGALLCLIIMGGTLRFHMEACRAEVLGDASQLGACTHPINKLFRGHMHTWMSDAVTSKVLQQVVWAIPMLACILFTGHFGVVANREVGWQPRSVVLYQVVSVATGLLAGLVGVGGGLILSPFFLLTGMEPAVAVGTSATCVLFTSSSTTMQYIFTDRIIMSLALVYGIVTLIASFIGTYGVHYIQDKFA